MVNFAKSDGDETDACDLTTEQWEKIYEKLFGGFEDIDPEEEERLRQEEEKMRQEEERLQQEEEKLWLEVEEKVEKELSKKYYLKPKIEPKLEEKIFKFMQT